MVVGVEHAGLILAAIKLRGHEGDVVVVGEQHFLACGIMPKLEVELVDFRRVVVHREIDVGPCLIVLVGDVTHTMADAFAVEHAYQVAGVGDDFVVVGRTHYHASKDVHRELSDAVVNLPLGSIVEDGEVEC